MKKLLMELVKYFLHDNVEYLQSWHSRIYIYVKVLTNNYHWIKEIEN